MMSIEEALVALHNATVSQGGTLHLRINGIDLDVVEALALGEYQKEAHIHRSLTAVDDGGVKQVSVTIRTASGSLEFCAAKSADVAFASLEA